jgi:hypothetical protein
VRFLYASNSDGNNFFSFLFSPARYMFDAADVEVSCTPLQPIPASPSEISGLFSAGAPLGSAGFSDFPAFFSPSNCVGGILSPISSARMRGDRLGDSMMSQNKTRLFQSPLLSPKRQFLLSPRLGATPCKANLSFEPAQPGAADSNRSGSHFVLVCCFRDSNSLVFGSFSAADSSKLNDLQCMRIRMSSCTDLG